MRSLNDYENVTYERAKQVKYSSKDKSKFLSVMILHILRITFVTIVEMFKAIVLFVIPQTPKNVCSELALVTGGANGLGRDIALRLAKEGCNIVIVDVNFTGAERTAKEIEEKFKVKTKAFKVDVSNYEEVAKLKVDIESSIGTVDILVNNAGVMPMMLLRAGNPEDLQKTINVNLTSHLFTCRIFLDGMIERKRGHIVAISSMAAKITTPLATAYSASKFGVDGFMSSLFDELCVDDHDEYIKLTTVYPTFINTRKELGDMLDKVGDISPRMTPKYAANLIVDGMLLNKRCFLVPSHSWYLIIAQYLPDKARKIAKVKIVKFKKFTKKIVK
ncbi:unnamed protein product [Diamesa hyperborea]